MNFIPLKELSDEIKIDIFKYMLESYKKIPFTEIYLFIKLDNEFLLPGQFFYNNEIGCGKQRNKKEEIWKKQKKL